MQKLLVFFVAVAVAATGASAAVVHDVKPIRDTQNIWGLMPYPDLEVTSGTKVIFRVPQGFHDVALVSTRVEMDDCDVSKANIITRPDGSLQPDFEAEGNNVTTEGNFYIFTWTTSAPGTYYFVCTIGSGKHCLAGQKFEIVVVEGNSDETVTVMGTETPFWTVAVGYPDMTISLGDSLRFVSDNQGYHDVVLLSDTCGASTNYDCCAGNTISNNTEAVLYSTEDFSNTSTEFLWTPEETGTHDVVCSVGSHCQFGQHFTVTVESADSGAAKTSLLVSAFVALFGFLFMAL
jgi:plastocyanin